MAQIQRSSGSVLRVVVLSMSFMPALVRADGATGSISGEVVTHPAKKSVGVVVWLEGVKGSFRPPARPVTIDQKGMTFVPHVVAIQKGGTVVFKNSDAVRHNVFTTDGEKYNLGTWGQGESKTHTFKETGVYHQLCNIHPEMLGFVVVLDNPFFAVTGADRKFEIKDVPPGSYTLKTWGEKLPEVTKQVTVAAGAPTQLKLEVGR
jgi:plastocyanin